MCKFCHYFNRARYRFKQTLDGLAEHPVMETDRFTMKAYAANCNKRLLLRNFPSVREARIILISSAEPLPSS